MTTTTHAIRVHAVGGPEALQWDEVELPDPPAGAVRMRNTAIGVNFIDTYHRTGLYPMAMPAILGGESAGVVEAVGPGVTDLVVGDRVGTASGLGAYAEHRNVPADRLVKLPAGVSDEVAAASMLKGMTVEYLIKRTFAVQAGQTVLLHAAAGGVGKLACQWLKHLGVTVIGTVGSDAKAELARSYGATHTIVYTRENIAARVRELTGGAGVPVVYDSVGKDTLMASLDSLAPRGLLVSYGNASGKPPPLDLILLSLKGSLYVTRPTLVTYTANREELVASAAALFDVIAQGVLDAAPTSRFALRDAAEAHRYLESRASTGATILIPSTLDAMKRAFVTGGSGFVGKALIAALVGRGVTVAALARSDAAEAAVRAVGATPVRGDLHDEAAMTAGMAGCDVVFHAAAYVQEHGPLADFMRDTLGGTERVLAAARAAGVKRMVHVSTEAVLADGKPIVRADETRPYPAKPWGNYAISKGAAERAVIAANGSGGLETVVIRPRFIWGKGDTSFVPKLVEAVRAKKFAWIGGGHYLTSTCHIANTVEGALLAAERGTPGAVYFLTDGAPVDFRDFLTKLFATQGVDPGPKSVPRWLARALARSLAWMAKPPITKTAVALIAHEVTVDDAKARRELGYTGAMSVDAGIAELTR